MRVRHAIRIARKYEDLMLFYFSLSAKDSKTRKWEIVFSIYFFYLKLSLCKICVEFSNVLLWCLSFSHWSKHSEIFEVSHKIDQVKLQLQWERVLSANQIMPVIDKDTRYLNMCLKKCGRGELRLPKIVGYIFLLA